MLIADATRRERPDSFTDLLVNLNQIRVIDQIRTDSARLVFSETFPVTIHGEKAVTELLAFVSHNSVLSDGRPLLEALGITEPKPPESA